MVHVVIKNYKTIKFLEFDIDKYTILIGKNFIGKSAAIHAIVAALKNSEGTGFIRHGERFSEVSLSFGDDKIVWHREEGNNFYVITYQGVTQEFSKMTKGEVPKPIIDMGFGPIVVSKEKTYLWYAKQFQTLFLIDRPKTDFSTDLIASVANLDVLYKASDLVKKDITSNKSTLKVRYLDLNDAKGVLKNFEPLEEYNKKKVIVEDLYKKCTALDLDLNVVENFQKELSNCASSLRTLGPITKLGKLETNSINAIYRDLEKVTSLSENFDMYSLMVSKLSSIDRIKDSSEFCNKIKDSLNVLIRIHNLSNDLYSAAVSVRKLAPVASIPQISIEPSYIKKLIQDIEHISNLEVDFLSSSKEVSHLSNVDRLKSITLITGDLRNKLSSIVEVESLSIAYDNAFNEVNKLRVATSIKEIKGLPTDLIAEMKAIEDLYTEIEDLTTRTETLKAEYEKVELEYTTANKDLSDFISELGVCPLCKSNISHQH